MLEVSMSELPETYVTISVFASSKSLCFLQAMMHSDNKIIVTVFFIALQKGSSDRAFMFLFTTIVSFFISSALFCRRTICAFITYRTMSACAFIPHGLVAFFCGFSMSQCFNIVIKQGNVVFLLCANSICCTTHLLRKCNK